MNTRSHRKPFKEALEGMPRTANVTFANLICRFGDKFFLLDLANEIVIPAFTDALMKRTYGRTSFFFLGVRIEEVENPADPAVPLLLILGRLVKDTVLTSEQVYDPAFT